MARANNDFDALNEALNQHKDRVGDGLNKKLDKMDFYWILGGIVGAFILFVAVVYSLSYSEIITDVKDLKNRNIATDKRLDKIDFSLDKHPH